MYNIPKRIGVNMTPGLVSRLADEVRNAVAIKESSNDFMQTVETIRVAGDRVAVLTGHSCERGFPALAMGARGFVSSVESQVMGREAVQLYNLAAGGHFDEARRIQQRCIAVDHGVHGLGTFPAGLKAAMNLVGRPGGLPRGPLHALDEPRLAKMRAVLEELGLIPQPALA